MRISERPVGPGEDGGVARPRGLSNFKLKIIGLVLVILASLGTAVVDKGVLVDPANADFAHLTVAVLLEAISWVAVPVYAWLLYSGFVHSHNLVKYGLRLLVLAVVSEVPYDLATSGRWWNTTSQNPVFALLVSLVVLCAVDYLRRLKSRASIVLIVLVCLAGVVWMVFFNIGLRFTLMPTGVVTLLFCLVFYFLHHKENTMMVVGTVVGALALITPAMGLAVVHFRNDTTGMRNNVDKYVFYALYPVCLLAIGLYGLTV